MRFPEFVGEWNITTLGECSKSLDYGLGAAAIDYDGIHKYIRITDIDDTTNQFISNNLTSPSFWDDECKVKQNDILFARTGASVGKTYYYDSNDGNLYYAGFLIAAHIIEEINSKFIFYNTLSNNYNKWVKITSVRSGQPGINAEEYGSYKFHIPTVVEQNKIALFMDKIDKRIQTQSKIIEDYNLLKKGIIHYIFSHDYAKISFKDIIKESSIRNKKMKNYEVLSVNNSLGFIKQSEQFEDRKVASANTSNYKIVNRNQYAYNPARINIGSIARLINYNSGIVSPMYIIFELDDKKVDYTFFDIFLQSIDFKNQLLKKLEGSVRQCLTFAGLQNMSIKLPSLELQMKISQRINILDSKNILENRYMETLKKQKDFLVNNMFI